MAEPKSSGLLQNLIDGTTPFQQHDYDPKRPLHVEHDFNATPPKSYARAMANAPREVQRHRETGLPEYERDPDAVLGEFITHDALICIVHAALRAGRGTETVKKLNTMLEPYGIRRAR